MGTVNLRSHSDARRREEGQLRWKSEGASVAVNPLGGVTVQVSSTPQGQGHRTVLVVPGRGLGSPGGRPVLKHAAVQWLSHGTLSGYVLGFVTARPIDGGAGALYVLLRRDRRKAAFDVLNGAKRRD